MSLSSVFNIAGSGMSAQNTRLNTVASNIANAETVSSSLDKTYRARHPVFATVFQGQESGGSASLFEDQGQAGALDGGVDLGDGVLAGVTGPRHLSLGDQDIDHGRRAGVALDQSDCV